MVIQKRMNCDHVIGISRSIDDYDEKVRVSDTQKPKDCYASVGFFFSYCPCCGEKLDKEKYANKEVEIK